MSQKFSINPTVRIHIAATTESPVRHHCVGPSLVNRSTACTLVSRFEMKRVLLIIFLPALLAQGYQDYPKWSGYEGVDNAAPPGYSQWMYPGSEDMPEYPDPEPSQASPDDGGWYIPPGALPSGFEVDDPTPTVVDDDTMLVANDDDVYIHYLIYKYSRNYVRI